MKTLLRMTLVAQLICLIGVLYATHQADVAMDKSGIGDQDLWRYWNEIADLFFWMGLVSWVVTFVGTAFVKWRGASPLFFSTEGRWGLVVLLILLTPVAFVATMLIVIIAS
jgi:hypothetical protein